MNQGMNLLQLFQSPNQIRAPIGVKFPIDGEVKVEKVLNHPASLQLWSVILSYSTNNDSKQNILVQKIAQLYRYLLEVSVCEVEKSVCAKIVDHGQTIVQCFDCRVDESCIICMQCFKNGNHKGHRVIFKKAGGGCCDCGDTQAWKEQGFCSKHSGKEKEIMIDEDQLRKTNQMLFELFYLYTYLKLSNNRVYRQFFIGFFQFLTKIIQKGLKGMKFVATFLNSELPKKLTVCSKLTGKILDQLMVIDFSGTEFRKWQNLFIEMFPVYTFKQQLLSSYIKCYDSLYSNSKLGLSISCQIMTSYKLVEDYADSYGAVPIVINPMNQSIEQVFQLTRMFVNDLYKINSLQGNAPLKYWKMQLKYGVQSLFGYYESLKQLAQKQKYKAAGLAQKQQKNKSKKEKQSKISKRKRRRNNIKNQSDDEESNEESFSILDFLKRHVKFIELEHSIIQQFLQILPVITKQEQLLNQLIKDLTTLISKQLTLNDDLLIFRPYDRMLAIVFYYIANQTPYLLTEPTIRSRILMASGMSEERWLWSLSKIQSRMTETLTFYTYIQTHQNQNYHHIFYVFIVVYCSAYYLLGYVDILAIKEIILLGAKQLTMDFESLAKFQFYEAKQRKWNLKIVSNLFTELGLVYIGHFPEIYISHYSQNHQVPKYIEEQSKLMLRKFITAAGGSANLQKITQFSHNFITNNEDTIKTYLKTICSFNKTRKTFELLPNLQDKNPINFKDFGIRAKTLNQHAEALPPASTLQIIDRENNIILASLWNKNNILSLCSILLQVIDQVLNKKSKDELIAFYSIPCRLSLFLKHAKVQNENFAPLTEMLQNLDVPAEIRKWLGSLANELSPLVQNNEMGGQQAIAEKQLQKEKKLKKLEELKKKKNLNLQKIKEIHQLSPTKLQSTAQECAICRKTGGSLVWISRLGIRNLENIFQLSEVGEGVLTFSFTSCYHVFDYECINQASIKRSNHEVLFRCPVCRTLGNVLININLTSQSQMYADAVLDRILQVAMTLRNYQEINLTQQLIKSFYHYVLLGYAQPNYVRHKRQRLYKKIINLLVNMKDSIDEVEKNLQQKKIMLVPKMAPQQKQKINLKEVVIEIQQDDYFSDEELQIWMIDRNRNRNLTIREQKQKMEEEIKRKNKPINHKKETSQYSKVFYYTLKRIITHIRAKRQQKSKKQNQQKQPIINQNQPEKHNHQNKVQASSQSLKTQQIDTKQVPEWAIFLLDQLLDKKQMIECEWNPPKLVKINLLPEKYYWDMTQNTCDYCNIICNDFFLCLLCDWKGCLNSCKRGGIKKHNKNIHGENGAFLRLKDATVYLMSPGEIKKAGCLYVNEWGEDFNIKNDWSKYYLQTSVIDQAVSLLIKDE